MVISSTNSNVFKSLSMVDVIERVDVFKLFGVYISRSRKCMVRSYQNHDEVTKKLHPFMSTKRNKTRKLCYRKDDSAMRAI